MTRISRRTRPAILLGLISLAAFLTSCSADLGAERSPTSTDTGSQAETVDEIATPGLKEACELHVDTQSRYISAVNGLRLGKVSDAEVSAVEIAIIEDWRVATQTFDDDISDFFDRMVQAVENGSFEDSSELESARLGLQSTCAGAGYPTEITSQYGG